GCNYDCVCLDTRHAHIQAHMDAHRRCAPARPMSGPRRLPRVRLPFGRDPDGDESATPGEDGGVRPSAIGVTAASATPGPTRLSETFRAFKHRNYRLYYSGQAVSLSGTWMQTVAQSWLVLQITDSKEALGVVTMLQFLPITL